MFVYMAKMWKQMAKDCQMGVPPKKEARENLILSSSRLTKLQHFVSGCARVCLFVKFIFHYADEKRCSPRLKLISA